MTYTENPKIPDELIVIKGEVRAKNNIYYRIPELDNIVIRSIRLGPELNKIGMNSQMWYDKHALGIENPEDRPKCPYCGKTRAWLGVYAGYRPTCGDKECKSKEYVRVQCESRKSNSDRWKKQRNTIGSSTQELSKAWKEYGESSGLTYHEFSSKFWKEWRERNGKLSLAEFKSTRHENMLKRKEAKRMARENAKNADFIKDKVEVYGGIKSRMYSKDDDRSVVFDSLWERSFFIKMTMDPLVKSIRRKTVRIVYYCPIEKKLRMYVPDFIVEYLNGCTEIIEIKPKQRINNNVLAKEKAAIEWCKENGFTYRLLTEIDLKAMGILRENGSVVYLDLR